MLLVVGERDDPLAQALLSRARSTGQAAVSLNESELFGSSFGLRVGRSGVGGSLVLDGHSMSWSELRGIVFRPQRRWRPLSALVADARFIYHETIAAWYSVLNVAPCAVFNPFSLQWWFDDSMTTQNLSQELAQVLEMLARYDGAGQTRHARGYLVDGRLIAASADARMKEAFARNEKVVSSWQAENGLRLCSVDFDDAPTLAIRSVDPFPCLEAENPGVIDRVAKNILEAVA